MTTAQALGQYLADRHIIEPGTPPEDWYRGIFFYYRAFGRRIPIFPMFGFKSGLLQHDVNHMLSGCDTSWRGEMELAGWELGSGGCGLNLIFWFDRLTFFAVGLLLAPLRTLRAARRGLRCRNSFGLRRQEILDMEVAELRRYATG